MKKVLFIVFLFAIANCFTGKTFSQQKQAMHTKVVSKNRPASTMLARLQGRWVSLDDKKTSFVIKGNRQTDIYGKQTLDTATINFYKNCPEQILPAAPKNKSGKFLVVATTPDDFSCYEVVKISASKLELIYVARGNTLRYKKVRSY